MMNIEFSIGPSNREFHDMIIEWLNLNLYNIKGISFNGDHFSEIHVYGDYNKVYDRFSHCRVSFEHWE